MCARCMHRVKKLVLFFIDGYYNMQCLSAHELPSSIAQISAHGSAMVLDLETPKYCVLRDVARSRTFS